MGLDISDILKSFRIRGDRVAARMIRGDDGRPLLQMRVSMGLLQMEMDGRPDGDRPHGFPSLLDYLGSLTPDEAERVLAETDCSEVDRELTQYAHRRICLLAVGSGAQSEGYHDQAMECFRRACDDAEHNLALMEFVRQRSNDPDFLATHDQTRPFVLFHRTLARVQMALLRRDYEEAIDSTREGVAAILASSTPTEPDEDAVGADDDLDEDEPEETEIEESEEEGFDAGLDASLLDDADLSADEPEEDEDSSVSDVGDLPDVAQWVAQLNSLIDQIRAQHGIQHTLREQIEEAVRREDFERAAELRRRLDARRPESDESR